MVIEIKINPDKTFYKCSVCGLIYEDREWALKCENFCSKRRACSLEITEHAISSRKGIL